MEESEFSIPNPLGLSGLASPFVPDPNFWIDRAPSSSPRLSYSMQDFADDDDSESDSYVDLTAEHPFAVRQGRGIIRSRKPAYLMSQKSIEEFEKQKKFIEGLRYMEETRDPVKTCEILEWIHAHEPEQCEDPETAFPYPGTPLSQFSAESFQPEQDSLQSQDFLPTASQQQEFLPGPSSQQQEYLPSSRYLPSSQQQEYFSGPSSHQQEFLPTSYWQPQEHLPSSQQQEYFCSSQQQEYFPSSQSQEFLSSLHWRPQEYLPSSQSWKPTIPTTWPQPTAQPNEHLQAYDPSSLNYYDEMSGAPYPEQERERERALERALRGNFIPLSKSLNSRTPAKAGHAHQESRFHLSLTESQMDKITVALSQDAINQAHKEEAARGRMPIVKDAEQANADKSTTPLKPALRRSRSPAKADTRLPSPTRSRSRSPVKFADHGRNSDARPARFEFRDTGDTVAIESTPHNEDVRSAMKHSGTPVRRQVLDTQHLRSPAPQQSPTPHRAARAVPPPIDVEAASRHAKEATLRKHGQDFQIHQSPPEVMDSPVVHFADDNQREVSSEYSHENKNARYPSHVSPLRISKDNSPPKASAVLQSYAAQRKDAGIPRSDSQKRLLASPDDNINGLNSLESAFSPLASLLSNEKPSVRKSSKTMIGQNGWLESTTEPAPIKQQGPSPARKPGFFDNIMKKAKEMMTNDTNDTKTQRKSHNSEKSQPSPRTLAISLKPREQCILYAELELALTTALDEYLHSELRAGRFDMEKMKKVAEAWQQKGRPKVAGFRYDLETQLDLVRLHVNDFKFYGRAATHTSILGIIDMMKVDARSLSVRTFCQPDTVIAKQLLDSQHLLNCIGCQEQEQMQLAGITNLFKAAMERERALAKRNSQRISLHETAHEMSLRHAKSHSGQSWNKAAGTGNGTTRRRSSSGALKMDPSSYDDSIF